MELPEKLPGDPPSSANGEPNGPSDTDTSNIFASPKAPALGEPDTLPLTYCRKCEAEVKPEGKGKCPRCGTFLRLNFVARRHPVNKLRREQFLTELLAEFRPTTVVGRTTCEHLAGIYEQLEALKPGSTEWQRLVTTAQTLGLALRDIPSSTSTLPGTDAMPTSALERAKALLSRLAAGDTLTEREQGALDVLHSAMRGETLLPPDPAENSAENPGRNQARGDDREPALPPGRPDSSPLLRPERPVRPEAECAYCHRPCVGVEHPAFSALHWNDPVEVKKRDEHATQVMLKMLPYGNPY